MMVNRIMVDTSLDAWAKAKPKLKKITAKVYDGIEKYPDHTTAELSKILNLPIPGNQIEC